MLNADGVELGSDDIDSNPPTLSTPLPDFNEMQKDDQDDEELKTFAEVSVDHDLDVDAIEDDDDDGFFDSVKSMFSDYKPAN